MKFFDLSQFLQDQWEGFHLEAQEERKARADLLKGNLVINAIEEISYNSLRLNIDDVMEHLKPEYTEAWNQLSTGSPLSVGSAVH